MGNINVIVSIYIREQLRHPEWFGFINCTGTRMLTASIELSVNEEGHNTFAYQKFPLQAATYTHKHTPVDAHVRTHTPLDMIPRKEKPPT